MTTPAMGGMPESWHSHRHPTMLEKDKNKPILEVELSIEPSSTRLRRLLGRPNMEGRGSRREGGRYRNLVLAHYSVEPMVQAASVTVSARCNDSVKTGCFPSTILSSPKPSEVCDAVCSATLEF
ncbi:hypothetical protein CKAH01_04753 [Colletotrichum kahawae]|uniref:Uncharacterized protein n=1 Tax=Colletotrichum kahawae TaxID=34407 RepID=A0AAE0D6T8_COLKA|nr:hypothetical protein CKAH01_04753 [Colletotrichum kahawae]